MDNTANKPDNGQVPAPWWKRLVAIVALFGVATLTQFAAKKLIPDPDDWRRWAIIVVVALAGGFVTRQFLGRTR